MSYIFGIFFVFAYFSEHFNFTTSAKFKYIAASLYGSSVMFYFLQINRNYFNKWTNFGCHYSLDWTTGLEYWTGLKFPFLDKVLDFSLLSNI